MKLKEVLDKTIQFFKDKGITSARLDAEILLAFALNIEKIQLYIKYDQPMTEPELEKCRQLVKRRSLGEPVAYIVGYKDFYKNRFKVSPAVLIPRPETELLVEEIVKLSSSLNKKKIGQVNNNINLFNELKNSDNTINEDTEQIIIADLGSGSGCIGLSLLKEIPNSICYFYDISTTTLSIAKENSEQLNLLNRCRFIESDLNSEHNLVNADIYISNPPYIDKTDLLIEDNVKKFEPHRALFSSQNGDYEILRWSSLVEVGIKKNNKKVIVGFEIGYNQSEKIFKHFEMMNCFDTLKIIKDYSDFNRHIVGVHNG